MLEDGIIGAQRLLNDMFAKLEMSHRNPYEVKKPIHPPGPKLYDQAR